MKKMEVVSGDIDPGKWEISPSGIKKGKYVVKRIPINDIVGLEKKEEVGRSVYANIELGTGNAFVAKMGVGAYKQLYSLFLSGGSDPKSSSLPIEKVSVFEVSILVIVSLILLVAFLR